MQRFLTKMLVGVALTGALLASAYAQSNDDTTGVASGVSATSLKDDAAAPVYVNKDAFAVRSIDGASALNLGNSLWNNQYFALTSTTFTQSYYASGSPSPTDSGSHLMSTWSANFALDRYIGRTRFAMQYKPQVNIVDGSVITDFLNQNASLNFAHQIAPRLSVSISDAFNSQKNQMFSGSPFSMDPTSGNMAAQNFLRGDGRTVGNSLSASFAYDMSARLKLAVTPTYSYAVAYGTNQSSTDLGGSYVGAGASLNYSLNPHRTVGTYYSHQNSFVSGGTGNSAFDSFGLSFSQQLNSWMISAQGGGSYVKNGTAPQSVGTGSWTGNGGVQIAKSFRNSRLAFSGTRSESFAGVISSSLNDRLDLTYSRQVGRRMGVTGGGGYFRTLDNQSGTQNMYGKYLSGQLQYELSPGVQAFFSVNRMLQSGDSLQIANGSWTYFTFGFTWGRVRPIQ